MLLAAVREPGRAEATGDQRIFADGRDWAEASGCGRGVTLRERTQGLAAGVGAWIGIKIGSAAYVLIKEGFS